MMTTVIVPHSQEHETNAAPIAGSVFADTTQPLGRRETLKSARKAGWRQATNMS